MLLYPIRICAAFGELPETTFNFPSGEEVPIPTFPELAIRNFSLQVDVLLYLITKSFVF